MTACDIQAILGDAGIPALPAQALERFRAYLDLMLRWNSKLNLTSIREPEQIVRRHFAECAFAAHHLPQDTATLLDYGSGAGFPGIPIAICRPDIQVTLAESQAKKVAFLREAVRTIEVPAVTYDGRVETLPAAQQYGAVTFRAVEKMETAIRCGATRARRYVVLMITESLATKYMKLVPDVSWGEPIDLPYSDRGILLIGNVGKF